MGSCYVTANTWSAVSSRPFRDSTTLSIDKPHTSTLPLIVVRFARREHTDDCAYRWLAAPSIEQRDTPKLDQVEIRRWLIYNDPFDVPIAYPHYDFREEPHMTTRHVIAAAVCLFSFATLTFGQTIVPNNSTWKWLHPTDGVDPATADEDFHKTFFLMDFDDSKWKSGKDKAGDAGGFGYGDPEPGVDMGRPEDGANRKTAYLRLKFKTEKDFENLVFKCQRDDAIIVYLDGKEVLRDNVEKNAKDAYSLFAEQTIANENETKLNEFPLKVKLPAGEHILAISLHNREGGSSDLRIAEISLEVKSEESSGSLF